MPWTKLNVKKAIVQEDHNAEKPTPQLFMHLSFPAAPVETTDLLFDTIPKPGNNS